MTSARTDDSSRDAGRDEGMDARDDARPEAPATGAGGRDAADAASSGGRSGTGGSVTEPDASHAVGAGGTLAVDSDAAIDASRDATDATVAVPDGGGYPSCGSVARQWAFDFASDSDRPRWGRRWCPRLGESRWERFLADRARERRLALDVRQAARLEAARRLCRTHPRGCPPPQLDRAGVAPGRRVLDRP